MAVAFDASSESHTGTTGSTAQTSFTWTHTPVGTPRGVLVFIMDNGPGSATGTSITYGSASLTQVTGGQATDALGEPGHCTAWFVGSGIPTGAQTVTVNRANSSVEAYAVAITVTAAADTQIEGTPVLLQDDGTWSQQTVGTAGVQSVAFAGAHSGSSAPDAVGANTTLLQSIDYGARINQVGRGPSAGATGTQAVGFTSSVSDDRAGVHLAVSEVSGTLVKVATDSLSAQLTEAGFITVPLAVVESAAVQISDVGRVTVPLAAPDSAAVQLSEVATVTLAIVATDTLGVQLSEVSVIVKTPTFDTVRQAIIDGLVSDKAEATGWNARRNTIIPVANVVRTSDTVVTITLAADAGFDITALETITATVPSSALVNPGAALVAAPTFTIDVSAGGTGPTAITATDSLKVQVSESPILLATLNVAETLQAQASERSVVVAMVNTADTAAVQTSEVSVPVAIVAVSETVVVQASEGSVPLIFLAPADTVTVQTADSVALFATLAVAESLRAGLSEAAALVVSVSPTDATAVVVTENGPVVVMLASADGVAVVLSEAGAIAAVLSGTDAVAVQIADAADLRSLVAASESMPVQLTESVIGNGTANVADTVAAGLSDSVDLRVLVATTEALAPQMTDSATIAISLTAQDAAAVQAGEGSTVFARLDVTESAKVQTSEATALFATLAAAETTAVALLEATDLRATVNAAETLVAQLSEVSSVSATLAGTDSVAVGLSDTTGALLVLVAAAEALGIRVSEAAALIVTLAASDSAAVIVGENGTVSITDFSGAVQIVGSDSLAIVLAEATTTRALLAVSEALLLGLSEDVIGNASGVAADTLRVASRQSYPGVILSDRSDAGSGVLTYWRLDEPQAVDGGLLDKGIANASSTYSSAGVTVNQTGAITDGTAYLFDSGGPGDVYTGVNKLNVPSAGSLEAWIKPTSTTGRKCIFANSGATQRISLNILNGKLEWRYPNSGGTADETVVSVADIPTNQWTHVVVTCDGDPSLGTGTTRIYINGALDTSQATTRLGMLGPAHLGNDTRDGNPFDGYIDEVSVWQFTLSAVQVLNHYNAGANPLQSETAAVLASLSVAESLKAVLTESGPVAALVDAADAAALQTSERSLLLVGITATEAAAIGATELARLLSQVAVSESVVLVTAESAIISATLAATDAVQVVVGESPGLLVSVAAASEALGISVSELARIIDLRAGSDSVAVTVIEFNSGMMDVERSTPDNGPRGAVGGRGWRTDVVFFPGRAKTGSRKIW